MSPKRPASDPILIRECEKSRQFPSAVLKKHLHNTSREVGGQGAKMFLADEITPTTGCFLPQFQLTQWFTCFNQSDSHGPWTMTLGKAFAG
jgi:hypothetical protein